MSSKIHSDQNEFDKIQSLLFDRSTEKLDEEIEKEKLIQHLFPYEMGIEHSEHYMSVFSPFFFLSPSEAQNSFIFNSDENEFIRFHFISRDEIIKQMLFIYN